MASKRAQFRCTYRDMGLIAQLPITEMDNKKFLNLNLLFLCVLVCIMQRTVSVHSA